MKNPPQPTFKTSLAIAAGKISAHLIHQFKMGSGTSLPGKVALKLDGDLLTHLGRQIRQKTLAITGTNGKSTTAGLLSAFIQASGNPVIHNQLGANMLPGITTALLRQSQLSGKLLADYGVIEVDEASLPGVATGIRQDLTIVTNLFRDQLDRYGELDTTAKLIQKGIGISGGALALNADDPMVTSIAHHLPEQNVIYYGVRQVNYPSAPEFNFPVGFPKEVTDCPLCLQPLTYTQINYGHLGHYHCPSCGFSRPQPDIEATQITMTAESSQVNLSVHGQPTQSLTLNLPGLFNAYNLLAAISGFSWLNLDPACILAGLQNYQSIFGRAERKQIQGKTTMTLLIKNPIGASEVLKVVAADPHSRVVIMINDNYADGRDISWLWDAPFEILATTPYPIIVSGHRAEDMAIRLRYGGLSEDKIQVIPDILQAFQQGLDETGSTETLYILPTYTALLQLSQFLKTR